MFDRWKKNFVRTVRVKINKCEYNWIAGRCGEGGLFSSFPCHHSLQEENNRKILINDVYNCTYLSYLTEIRLLLRSPPTIDLKTMEDVVLSLYSLMSVKEWLKTDGYFLGNVCSIFRDWWKMIRYLNRLVEKENIFLFNEEFEWRNRGFLRFVSWKYLWQLHMVFTNRWLIDHKWFIIANERFSVLFSRKLKLQIQ